MHLLNVSPLKDPLPPWSFLQQVKSKAKQTEPKPKATNTLSPLHNLFSESLSSERNEKTSEFK